MNWTSLLANPSGLRSVYGGDVPDLRGLSLHGVEFRREGPSLMLRFDLPSYPAEPPAKWAARGFDTVQVVMGLSGVRTAALDGFASDPVADISLYARDGVTVEVASASVRLRATADTAYVARLSAYATTHE
ncbi:Imm50 family immunity protein [Streptomyces cinereoruber]|uniref:Imm50 family immunity protein n=1 Tax=Streptomyces cinereoruber TaxID=67260 RepID=UPI00345C7DD4